MYTATLEPLLNQCNRAIEMASSGAIDDARVCLDRIRFLRSLLAHSRGTSVSSGPEHHASKMSQTPALLQQYADLAAAVNQRLETIRQWITQSRAAFSIEELRQSYAGMNLFIDDALPAVWDFKQDIVLLTDLDGDILRELLRERGQSKFIWVTNELPRGEHEPHLPDNDTLFVLEGQHPKKADLEIFLRRYSVPRAALLTTFTRPEDEQHFHTVARAIGSAVIAGSTTQWLPQVTAKQWLESAPTLAKLPSLTELQTEFDGADVLVVSPGPSLKQDMKLLAEVQDRFLIFASVKALSALFDAGVKPDLAIWQDPRDHSHVIPDRAEIADVGLVLSEGCHPAFYNAGFATYFPYPDPGFLRTELSAALHGESGPSFPGTSVSTVSAVIALELNARSVTLLGQDLSIAGGLYVAGGVPSDESDQSQDGHLTCKGIDGEQLPTLPNYYSFISEFENIAQHFKGRVSLWNATSAGAYLEGWDHVPFGEHPLIKEKADKARASNPVGRFKNFPPRTEAVFAAMQEMIARLDHAAKICREIRRECLEKIQTGSNDCTVIDLLEQRLKVIFDEECSLLKYYTSRQSMALMAATESVQTLEQNLQISADYYDAIGQAAEYLITLSKAAVGKLALDQKVSRV